VGAGSEELLKKEVSFGAGSRIPGRKPIEGITMQLNKGGGTDNVFADIQGLIFHSDLYDDAYQQNVQQQAGRLQRELNDLTSGRITARLQQKIDRAANLSADDFDQIGFSTREGLQRYIDEATTLQADIILGNQNPSNVKGLNERLVKFLQKQYLTDTRKTVQASSGNPTRMHPKFGLVYPEPVEQKRFTPRLPFAQRNSIDTEARVGMETGEMKIGTPESPAMKNIMLEDGTKIQGYNYRLAGHKQIVPNEAAERLYQAFGGFDLDDKVISDLHFIRDSSGARRLASFVWRQPTGPQEVALMLPKLDEGTLTRLLGSDTDFAERFQVLAGAASDLVSEHKLHRIPTAKVGITAMELDKLTREEKIIKYVSLMATGNRNQAKRYVEGMADFNKQSFFDDVEKAIFTITDIGQTDELRKNVGN